METIDLTQLTIDQLKARAYDLIAQKEFNERNLVAQISEVNKELMKRFEENKKVEEAQVVEQKPE